MELLVEGKGCFLGKYQGRLRVTREQKVIAEAPLINLHRVIILSTGVSLSSDVVRVCSEEGIPIHFLSSRGNPTASLYSAGLSGTVLTRRGQLLSYTNERGIVATKAFIRGKIESQANTLRYMAKYRKETNHALYQQFTNAAITLCDHVHELERYQGAYIEDIREQLLSVEGRAAQHYWKQIGALLSPELAWPGRLTKGASDPFNSALNYGYGILYCQVEQALVLAGLDPYAGFLHADRPGKPSLVLDCIEEFRQTIVDRTIVALVNKHVAIEQDEQHRLSETIRKKIAEKIHERLAGTELYEKKRQTLRFILQSQARHLAHYLRGDRPTYEPFIVGW